MTNQDEWHATIPNQDEWPKRGESVSGGRWEDPARKMWSYKLTWRLVDDRPVCVAVELKSIGDKPITAALLRTFPIGALMAKSRAKHKDLQRWVAANVPERRAAALALAEAWERSKATRSGPKGYGAAHFADVATIYRTEAMRGNRPTQAVADRFVVSKSAAAKWVARARAMGLLPPAQKGKAG